MTFDTFYPCASPIALVATTVLFDLFFPIFFSFKCFLAGLPFPHDCLELALSFPSSTTLPLHIRSCKALMFFLPHFFPSQSSSAETTSPCQPDTEVSVSLLQLQGLRPTAVPGMVPQYDSIKRTTLPPKFPPPFLPLPVLRS